MGTRPQIVKVSEQTDVTSKKARKGARPQVKEASKQIDSTSKKVLVHKLRNRADKTTNGHVRACPQIKEASKQTDMTSKRHA